MASEDRRETVDLIARMLADPRRADFFLLVRALQAAAGPGIPRVGESLKLSQEVVRFGQPPFLDFAAASIDGVRTRRSVLARTPAVVEANPPAPKPAAEPDAEDEGARHKIYQYFFGLFGPNGALPLHLTEYALSRWRHHKDPVLIEFADLFHDRMVAFFFRAWAEARMEVDFDRGLAESRFATYIGSLCGLGSPSVYGRDSIGELAKLHYVGHLARQVRNAEGLRDLLQDYFQVPVEVLTFQGRWLELPMSSRCRLGGPPGSRELGQTTLLGSRVWDCQLTIRIRIGPLGLSDVARFLPGGKSFQRLRDWLRIYCTQPFFWDVQMVVLKEQVKPIQLGGAEPGVASGCGGRLGWTTWLTTRPLERNPEDLILKPEQ